MNLVVDFGNTSKKAALFNDNKLVKDFYQISEDSLSNIYNNYKPNNCIISSTNTPLSFIRQFIHGKCLLLTYQTKLSFKIEYDTPQTLGLDRIASIAGAKFLFPDRNLLVIDMGTCITYDVLLDGIHKVGGISPGMNIRFKSLNHYTSNLPLLEYKENVSFLVTSSENSIVSGVINGIVCEINEIISRYIEKFGTLEIILTGGDGVYFKNRIKSLSCFLPKLVFIGLNSILNDNV